MQEEEDGSRIQSGMAKKQPRWVVPFLKALERTGEVEAAARDSGIEKSTAYYRRKAHPEFAAGWDEALRLHSERTNEEIEERAKYWEGVKNAAHCPEPPRSAPLTRPSPEGEGWKAELFTTTALGGQVKHVGPGRWNAAAERRFFHELAATANVSRAAAAAGVSKNAVYARRMKRPDFRAKWDAVLETGRSAIEMHLVEAAKKSFDPEDLDVEGVEPKVSVAEAIRIVQLHGSKAQKREVEEVETPESEAAEIRQRLIRKLERYRAREMPRKLAEGWHFDESWDQMVPPGWVKAPDYTPKPPDPPLDSDE